MQIDSDVNIIDIQISVRLPSPSTKNWSYSSILATKTGKNNLL
jgi:hypothetical protein